MNATLQQRAEAEITSLLLLADDFVSAAKVSPNGLSPEEIGQVTTWLSRIGQLIRKLYGKDSQHFESYKDVGFWAEVLRRLFTVELTKLL